MRYVVGRNRAAAAGQLIISIIYLLINIIYLSNNLIWLDIFLRIRARMPASYRTEDA